MAELSYALRTKADYSECKESLKETSFDKENHQYLCQNSMEVYPQKQPSSYDSLIVDEKRKIVYCIEFKNQIPSAINNATVPNVLKAYKDENYLYLIDLADLSIVFLSFIAFFA